MLAASVIGASALVAGGGVPAAMAGCSTTAHWEVIVLTNYNDVFVDKWNGSGIDNESTIQQGPETFASTADVGVSSTVSASLGGSLSADIASVSADLGISLTTSETVHTTKSISIYAAPDTTEHVAYGAYQSKTYDQRDYVQSNCTVTNVTYGYVYGDDGQNYRTWPTSDG